VSQRAAILCTCRLLVDGGSACPTAARNAARVLLAAWGECSLLEAATGANVVGSSNVVLTSELEAAASHVVGRPAPAPAAAGAQSDSSDSNDSSSESDSSNDDQSNDSDMQVDSEDDPADSTSVAHDVIDEQPESFGSLLPVVQEIQLDHVQVDDFREESKVQELLKPLAPSSELRTAVQPFSSKSSRSSLRERPPDMSFEDHRDFARRERAVEATVCELNNLGEILSERRSENEQRQSPPTLEAQVSEVAPSTTLPDGATLEATTDVGAVPAAGTGARVVPWSEAQRWQNLRKLSETHRKVVDLDED